MASSPVHVSIQGPDGSCIKIQVEPGTTISAILDHEALMLQHLPAGYRACLIEETAVVLEPDSRVWETQVLTLVRFKNVIQTSTKDSVQDDQLVFVEVPMGVDAIGPNAFELCTSLQEVEIPNSVTRIEMCAFKECVALKHMLIPDSVTSIEGSAFLGCIALETIKIPNVTNIGLCAFKGCNALKHISIPDSVASIEGSVFFGMHGIGDH